MEGNLRILMTADTVGGVWNYAMTLCGELGRYNTEVHLLTMGRLLNEGQRNQAGMLGNVILYESDYKLEWMDDPAEDIRLAREWMKGIYETVQPDIIHFNNYSLTAGEWDCPVVTVFHSCVCTWFRAVKNSSAPLEWQEYREMVNDALFSSQVVVFPSFGVLGQAKDEYGPITHAQVIYNGILQGDSPIVEKQPFILSAGRIWDEAKNITLISGTAGELQWPVAIAGDNTGPGGKVFRYDNVIFLGSLRQDELLEKMQEAAIFVSGAFYEPFGLAILEAAASGCALALSDIRSLREIWGDAALYFDPDSGEQAAACLQQLINDDSFRNMMGERARARAQDYTAAKMAASYMHIYNTVRKEITNQQN